MTADTPKTAEELAPTDLEQVTAAGSSIVNFAMGDGSVRTVRGSLGATDLAIWQSQYGAAD